MFLDARCFRRGVLLVLAILCLADSAIAGAPREAQKAVAAVPAPDAPERMELLRVQILLDRADFRPGKLDGLGGEFTQKAADRYCLANGLPPGSLLDTSGIPSPYREYTVAEDDLKWVGPQASKPPEQAKLKAMLYSDLWEFVAERFHCDLDFLYELNPALPRDGLQPGAVLRVPDVAEFQMAEVADLEKQRAANEKAKKAAAKSAASASPAPESAAPSPTPAPPPPARRLALLRKERLIEVYENDRIIACFPCTPGSNQTPVPLGNWKITSNILLPYFRWDKSVLESGVPSETAYNLPPGPNNPVGIVWMSINRPSVGMHGTPTPDQIGRNQSHGCIRLANWDAFVLCRLVVKGTPVEVRDL